MQAKQSNVKEQSLWPSKHAVLHGLKEVMTERGCSELTVIWSHEMGDNYKSNNQVWVSNKRSNLGKVNEMHKLI